MKIFTSKTAEERLTKDKEAKTREEILSFAEEEGVELPNDALDHVAGGGMYSNRICPECGNTTVVYVGGAYAWCCYICYWTQDEF